MWSVVTESPTHTSARAPATGCSGAGSGATSFKNGGSWMYVDDGSHWYSSPTAVSSDFHRESPSKILANRFVKNSGLIASAVRRATSAADGQISDSITGFPSRSVPSGSVVRSMSTVPASPYATTRGGDARNDIFTCGWIRPSKFLLPLSTAATVRDESSIACATGSGSGPEFP